MEKDLESYRADFDAACSVFRICNKTTDRTIVEYLKAQVLKTMAAYEWKLMDRDDG